MTILTDAQLFAVARDQIDAVIGACTEHQDDQDPRGLAVDREVEGLDDEVDDATGDRVGDADDDERNERDDRRPVDQEQQDEDQNRRADQELAIDVAEDLDGVDGDAGRSGDVDGEPVGSILLGDRAHVLDDRFDLVDHLCRQGHDHDGRRAVLRQQALLRGRGAERGLDRRVVRQLREGLLIGGDHRSIGVIQPVGILIDDQRGDRASVVEARAELIEHLGRVRTRRQEGRRIVLRDRVQLGLERAEPGREDDPGEQDEPLGAAAGDDAGESFDDASSGRVRPNYRMGGCRGCGVGSCRHGCPRDRRDAR